MWELDHKESWAPKNWCFWTVVLEKTLESPLDCKEIQPVHLEGDQSWIFIRRTDAEAPILWPPDVKNWLSGKDPEAGKDWRQEEKGMTEDQMIGWHHRLNGPKPKQALGAGDGQRSLVCCSPWYCKESETKEQLTWTALEFVFSSHWRTSLHHHHSLASCSSPEQINKLKSLAWKTLPCGFPGNAVVTTHTSSAGGTGSIPHPNPHTNSPWGN